MSENQESSREAAERARKGKEEIISDDDQKEKENTTKVGDDSLSAYSMVLARDGIAGSLDYRVKQQLRAFENFALTKNPVQNPQIAASSKEDSDGETQIQGKDTNSDAKKEETERVDIKPDEQLIFELQISKGNRLVVPYAMAVDYFPPMLLSPNAEETLYLIDPRGERWQMTLTYDINANTYIIKNGLNTYIERNRLVRRDLIRVYLPIPQADKNNFYINHHKKNGSSLFEVRVSHSNRLRIPCDFAVNYFVPMDAPQPPFHLKEFILRLTDYLDQIWDMKYVVFEDDESYIIIRGWESYATYHGLIPNDTIRFFKNFRPNAGINSFIVHHELIRRGRSRNEDPVGMDRLCWELSLTEADVKFGRLELKESKIPLLTSWRDKEMVKLTDWKNKDWYVIMTYQRSSGVCLILDGWEDIVSEHNLEAGDLMRIYEPDNDGDNEMHFVIQFGKKRKRKTTDKKDGSGSEQPDGSGKPDDDAGSGQKIIKLG